MAQERTLALLASAFGILAALMSAVGLYGVLAFDILQRTREIGVRMALGATRPVVARLLLVETLRLAGISIAVAVPMAWGLAHLVRSLLFGVTMADPLTYFAAAMLVGLVALAAASIPTWRAASIEPMRALALRVTAGIKPPDPCFPHLPSRPLLQMNAAVRRNA